MQPSKKKRLLKWAGITITLYILIAVAIFFFHDKIILQSKPLDPTYHFTFKEAFREINLPVNAEKNISIIQFTVPDSLCRGVVLYFHGNKENIEHYAAFAKNFTRNHYEVWMMDYPGFGKSTGECSEQIMYRDAETVYQMARSAFAKDSIIIYGKSLGTGIATYLASVKDSKQLILESPYYSMDALMKKYLFMYPVHWLTKYHFPSNEYIRKVEAPVTIFHGTADRTIPFHHAEKLKAIHPSTILIPITDGEHNNLNDFPLFHEKLNQLLSDK